MWQSLIENKESIEAIYGTDIPALADIQFHELKITFGEDNICNLRFDFNALPNKLPEKWVLKEVKTVQLNLTLIACKIISFEMEGGCVKGDIEISPLDIEKLIVFKVNRKNVFIIKAKWIFIESLNGYLR